MPKDNWKKQTWWSLPVYTGDVSGVCSALYELGGMVVMHDPSGCNSTFNTHDEIRWVEQESLIFLSGLTQLDAITGNDRKLIDDITAAANEFHPAFIAIANSPVPWLIGTDFLAICKKVTEQTQIPAFYIETNAMHDYTRGAGLAFLELAVMLFSRSADPDHKVMPETERSDAKKALSGKAGDKEKPEHRIRVNVLGATPLDFTVMSQIDTLRSILQEEGFEVVSVWGIGDGLDDLKKAGGADVNLVLSSAGIYAARWMEENLNIPYVAGVPVGAFAEHVLESLRKAAAGSSSQVPYLQILDNAKAGGNVCEECFAGEPVTMGSLAADRVLATGKAIDLIPLTETIEGLIMEGSTMPRGERQITEQLSHYRAVTADPMLECACRADCDFTERAHFALSGRLYLNEILPIITKQTGNMA